MKNREQRGAHGRSGRFVRPLSLLLGTALAITMTGVVPAATASATRSEVGIQSFLDEPLSAFAGRDLGIHVYVRGPSGGAEPTGTVTITDESGAPAQTFEVWQVNQDLFPLVHPSAPGTGYYSVAYSGDEHYVAATVRFSYAVHTGPATTISVSSNVGGQVASGTPVALTAKLTLPDGGALTGRNDGHVEFYDNGNYLGDGAILDALGWLAGFTTDSLTPGPHAITAVFASSIWYEPSQSAPLRLDVVGSVGPASGPTAAPSAVVPAVPAPGATEDPIPPAEHRCS